MIFNVINREELRDFLRLFEKDFGLPPGLAVQALERPLLRRRACLNVRARAPMEPREFSRLGTTVQGCDSKIAPYHHL